MSFLRIKLNQSIRSFASSARRNENHSCKLLIVGGGTGGCAMAAKFAKTFNKNEVIVIEPSKWHYYQPMFTLVGGGMEDLNSTAKLTKNVLPSSIKQLNDSVKSFEPKDNLVVTLKGDKVKYEFMIVAIGLELNYDKIPGLLDGLNSNKSEVSSIYSPKYVKRTFESFKKFENGNAVFTFPNSPVKCPGAPQKICYIFEDYLRLNGNRANAHIIYNTSLPVLFGVKKYADALWKVVNERDIEVNLRTNLIEVKPKEKIAVFQNLDKPEFKSEVQYSMLHVVPPMSAPEVLRNNKDLANEQGFMNVNNDTMQHLKFSNIFSIGDCSGTPNSKTAAAAAVQSGVVYDNLRRLMMGLPMNAKYNGYASCPLVTGYSKCILAEFDYNLTPLETFPFEQDRELRSMFIMKKDVMPFVYWNLMMKGYWDGPEIVRNILHCGRK